MDPVWKKQQSLFSSKLLQVWLGRKGLPRKVLQTGHCERLCSLPGVIILREPCLNFGINAPCGRGKKKLNQVCCPLSPLPPRNGSVVVRGEVLFRGDAPAPTNSHLIRTVVTEASKGRSIFSWQLDPQSVQSGGKS